MIGELRISGFPQESRSIFMIGRCRHSHRFGAALLDLIGCAERRKSAIQDSAENQAVRDRPITPARRPP